MEVLDRHAVKVKRRWGELDQMPILMVQHWTDVPPLWLAPGYQGFGCGKDEVVI